MNMAVGMTDSTSPDEMRAIWDQLAAAPNWCARHKVGTLLRSKISDNLFETVEAPRLEGGLLLVKVCKVGRKDLLMDLRASFLEPVDGLTALGEQAE
jgi:hypothetical protein